MESPSIENAITPISLPSIINQRVSALRKYKCGRATSTPLSAKTSITYQINPASAMKFGRKLSFESDYVGAAGFATVLDKMTIIEKSQEPVLESSSNSHTEVLKKLMNKAKRRKSILSPSENSPKMYKIKLTDCGENLRNNGLVANSKTSPEKSKKGGSKKSPTCSNGSHGSKFKLTKFVRPPKLQTAVRAKIKKEKEKIRKEKEKEQLVYKKKYLDEQKRIEEEEILKLRKETVFKANPIRKYAPLPAVKKRALTDPISPQISKRRRNDSSAHSKNSDYIQ